MWVKWNSQANFDKWHNQVKKELGLPKPSVDENGNVVPEAILNESYVIPIVVSTDDIRANVDELYAADLELTVNPQVSNYGND